MATLEYQFVDEPVAATQPIERALVQVDAAKSDLLELEADIVVVGSGAGGGVIAARLAEAGRDVLVLEAAEYLAEADLPRNEMDGFNQLYLDRGLTATSDLSLGILAGSAVGGGTMINWTTCIEPPAAVRADWAKTTAWTGSMEPAPMPSSVGCARSWASARRPTCRPRTN